MLSWRRLQKWLNSLLLGTVAWWGFQAVSAKWRNWAVQRQPSVHFCLKLLLLSLTFKFRNTNASYQLALVLPDITCGEKRNLCKNKIEKWCFSSSYFPNCGVWLDLIFALKFPPLNFCLTICPSHSSFCQGAKSQFSVSLETLVITKIFAWDLWKRLLLLCMLIILYSTWHAAVVIWRILGSFRSICFTWKCCTAWKSVCFSRVIPPLCSWKWYQPGTMAQLNRNVH